MDQGAIMVVKCKLKRMYYEKMLQYNLNTTYNYLIDDPVVNFMKTYTMLDAINDVGQAWDEISPELLHKCFEKVFDIKLYLKLRNKKCNINDDWTGKNFHGFDEESTEITEINKQHIEHITNQINIHLNTTVNKEVDDQQKLCVTEEDIEADVAYDRHGCRKCECAGSKFNVQIDNSI